MTSAPEADGYVLSTQQSPVGTDEKWDAFGFDLGNYDRWISVANLYYQWLRVQTEGLTNVPDTGAAILVGNHAGLRVIDLFSLQAALRRHHPARRWIRTPLHIGTEKALLFGHFMTQYAGGIAGRPKNARYLLNKGELLATYPEGGNSTGKRFQDRDVLCDLEYFGSGWARLALDTGHP